MTSLGSEFSWRGRPFLRGVVPRGDNRGRTFTIAQPLARRYQVTGFYASGGVGLVLEAADLRTGGTVLVKCVLHYDLASYARVRDEEGFARQLRLPRKTLEMERRILVLVRNAGCNAVPHPHDFVFDGNPLLAEPFEAEGGGTWAFADDALLECEPYLIMEAIEGKGLDDILIESPFGRLDGARAVRLMMQVTDVLSVLHQPRIMKPGMTWQLIYQDLKPAHIFISAQDRVTLLDLGGCQLINVETGQKLLAGAATAGYCPPESTLPYAQLTPAADVYTIGTTLFHVITGRSPREFLPSTLGSNQPLAARLELKLLEGLCSNGLIELIRRCLADEPQERFRDAKAIHKAMAGLFLENSDDLIK